MASLGSLTVDVRANTQKFVDGMKTAHRGINRFEGSVRTAGRTLLSFKSGILAVAGVAGFGALTASALKSGDALAKTADKLGITTEALAGLEHAAALTGVSQETFRKALTRQQKAIFDADRGLLTYKQHFDALGLSTEQLKQQSPDQQFITIAEALNQLGNQTQKTSIAYDIFGGRATALLNTMALGKEGLMAASDEARALGIAISRVDAAKMEAANDSMTRAGSVVKGLGNAVAINLAPFITDLVTRFVNVAKEAGGMSNFVAKAMGKVIDAVGFAADMVRGLQAVWAGLKVVALGAISAILTGLDELNKSGASALSWVPGLDIKPSPALSDWAESSRQSLIGATDELSRLVNTPMPSTNIKKWSEDVQYQAQTAAKAVAAARTGTVGTTGAPAVASIDTKAQDRSLASLQQHLTQRVDAISASLMTEQERTREAYNNRQLIIEESFQRELISDQRRAELLQKIEADHQNAMARLSQQRLGQQLTAYGTFFNSLISLSQGRSKALFKIAKIGAIATATVDAYTSFNAALKNPPGPPFTYPIAAAALATGLAKVAAIRSTSFSAAGGAGGAGGGGAVGAPVPATPTAAPSQLSEQAQRAPQVVINFHAPVNGDEGIRQTVADALRAASDYEYVNLEVVGTGQRVRVR